MRAKVEAVFIGKVENSFKNDDGETIDYRQIAVNVPGEMDSCVLSVPKDVEFDNLVPYQPCFLIVDFRFNHQYRNYKARVVRIVADADELANVPLYYDNVEANGYLASLAAGQKSAKAASKN